MLRLSPASRKSAKKVLKQLRKGKKAKASVQVALIDEAGNAAEETVPVTLTGKKKKEKEARRQAVGGLGPPPGPGQTEALPS